MPKRYIIGLGTGRCGTLSLCKLLNLQNNTSISHEKARAPWIQDLFIAGQFFKRLDQMDEPIVGDICFSWLPYVESLNEIYKDKIHFICIKRDRGDTIDSYMRKCIRLNNWTEKNSEFWAETDEINYVWYNMYPKYNLPKRDAIAQYCDDYYKEAERLEKLLPNFIIFDTEHILNRATGQEQLFRSLGYKEPEYKLNIKENKGRHG